MLCECAHTPAAVRRHRAQVDPVVASLLRGGWVRGGAYTAPLAAILAALPRVLQAHRPSVSGRIRRALPATTRA